jgi:hypothetical protein
MLAWSLVRLMPPLTAELPLTLVVLSVSAGSLICVSRCRGKDIVGRKTAGVKQEETSRRVATLREVKTGYFTAYVI